MSAGQYAVAVLFGHEGKSSYIVIDRGTPSYEFNGDEHPAVTPVRSTAYFTVFN